MDSEIYKQYKPEKLRMEFLNWQGKMNELRLQMYLGTRDVQDKLLPHIRKLETEYSRVKEKWKDFDGASERIRKEIEQAMKESFKNMNRAFNEAKKYFENLDN